MRRLEHPVRTRARVGRAARDRDEPEGFALVRACVEGDRLPNREDRGEAGRRLHARRDSERPHRHHTGEFRANPRLRGRQVSSLRVREVPGRRHDARNADEVRRRGDGDRADVRRGVPQGRALARARRRGTLAAASDRASVVPRGARPRARLARPRRRRRGRLPALQARRARRRRHRSRGGRTCETAKLRRAAVVPSSRLMRR